MLTGSSDPVQVACALRDHGFLELYVADLDAIESGEPESARYRKLAECGLQLWIDCGLRSVALAEKLLAATCRLEPRLKLIVGLESLPDPDILERLAGCIERDQLVFSLDLLAGKPLTSSSGWTGLSPLEIAALAANFGIRQIIVLDLARVGSSGGVSTHGLCRQLVESGKWDEVITGGGVRNEQDVHDLAQAGCTAALVGSALHSGMLDAAVAGFSEGYAVAGSD